MSVSYELPWPPTMNHLWITLSNRRRIRSPEYRAWAAAAGMSIVEQGRKRLPVGHGPVKLTIAAVRPDKRRRDISNLIKATEDLMVEMGIIEDDSLVEWIDARWVPEGDPFRVTVEKL